MDCKYYEFPRNYNHLLGFYDKMPYKKEGKISEEQKIPKNVLYQGNF